MPNNILRLAARNRSQVDRIDAANLKQVQRAYLAMYGNLQGDIDALRLAIEAVDKPTVATIKALPQYKALLRRSDDELKRFTVYLETVIQTASNESIGAGLSHSSQLINAMLGGRFSGLKSNVVAPLLDYLRRDGPLYKRLQLIAPSTTDKVVDSIIQGVGLGKNPRAIAAEVRDAFGGGLTDALRNTRTVQLYSYRDSARANYTASGVVEGWIWYAELDPDTCLSCVAQHGTIHGLDETLDDHYNGRCAALPYIPEFGNPVEQSGKEWFDSLPEAEQAKMMGQEKHGAYKDGKFEFDKLSQQFDNEVYGHMRSEASLKSLIGE